MAVINPNPTQGASLYSDPTGLDPIDDRLDRRDNGAIDPEPTELSATGFAKVLDLLRYCVTLLKTALLDVDTTGVADGNMLTWNETQGKWLPAAPTDTDEKVKLDSDDPTAGYLADKIDNATIIANEGGTIQVGTIGDNEIAADAAIAWSKLDKTGAVPGDVGAAAASHNHNASDINAGNLALTRAPLPVQEAHTTGDTLTHAADAGIMHTNAGATAEVELTLPNAAAGVGPFLFACMDTDGIKLRAPGTFKIRHGSNESSAGGYLASTTIGSTVTLIPVYDAGAAAWVWLGLDGLGTWSAA